MTHTRKPLLALAAGLCMPGLGHVYLGDLVRGASCLLGVSLLVPAAARLALWLPAGALCFVAIGGVLSAAALYLWSALEAFRLARRAPEAPLTSYQRPSVYALYVAVGYVFVLTPFSAHAREHYLETFVVPSGSMQPTILPGDRLLADKTVGQLGGPKLWRGALAIFVYPNDRTLVFVKRVIGLPGDRVELDGKHLRVNGRELATADGGELGEHGEYRVLWPADAEPSEPVSLVVPKGEVFVLGDNRAHTVDSRRFGSVPIADVKAVARQVWFSAQRGEGIRWQRIGQVLN